MQNSQRINKEMKDYDAALSNLNDALNEDRS